MAHEKAFVLVQSTSHCPRCDALVCGNALDRERDNVAERKMVVEYRHDHTLTVKRFQCIVESCGDYTTKVLDPHAEIGGFTCGAARVRFDGEDRKRMEEMCGGPVTEVPLVDADAEKVRVKADIQPDEVRWSTTFVLTERS